VTDADEIARVHKAAILSAAVFRYAFAAADWKNTATDQDKRCFPRDAGRRRRGCHAQSHQRQGLRPELWDPCYPPIIRSVAKDSIGRAFDLPLSEESD
jgi:hypothetical protein